jgi:hypothetical protein
MGLFDLFKKKPEGPRAPAPSGLLATLIGRYALQKATPPSDSALAGEWWEQPPNDDLLLAFMMRGDKLMAFLGEPAEVTEIYLVREPSGEFRLGASTESPDLPAVRRCLPRFSAWVEELQVFDNAEGLSLRFGLGAAPEQVEADLEAARAVLTVIEK